MNTTLKTFIDSRVCELSVPAMGEMAGGIFYKKIKKNTIIKRGLNLEWDVQRAHTAVTVRCSLTFGHRVYYVWLFLLPM